MVRGQDVGLRWPGFEQIDKLVGEQLDQIAEQFDKESQARAKLEDRVRELMLEQAKAATTIAKLEVAVAQLELRLANGDRRGLVVDANPPTKSLN
jgi:hypothetical protein